MLTHEQHRRIVELTAAGVCAKRIAHLVGCGLTSVYVHRRPGFEPRMKPRDEARWRRLVAAADQGVPRDELAGRFGLKPGSLKVLICVERRRQRQTAEVRA